MNSTKTFTLRVLGYAVATQYKHNNKRIHMDYPVMVGRLVQRCSVGHKTDRECLHTL